MTLSAAQKPPAGFTIVELLIVIVVIGILAAITIVSFNGVQNRANDTAVQSDITAVGKKMSLFYVENNRYPTNVTELDSLQLRASRAAYNTSRSLNFSYCVNSDRSGYAIGGISKSGRQYYVSSVTSMREYSSTLLNDGNREDISTLCTDLIPGGVRLQAGYYSADTVTPWRSWTGV